MHNCVCNEEVRKVLKGLPRYTERASGIIKCLAVARFEERMQRAGTPRLVANPEYTVKFVDRDRRVQVLHDDVERLLKRCVSPRQLLNVEEVQADPAAYLDLLLDGVDALVDQLLGTDVKAVGELSCEVWIDGYVLDWYLWVNTAV